MNPVVLEADKKTFRFLDAVPAPKEVKLGKTYLRKMKTYVKCMDMNNDGVMTRKDFELLADRRNRHANLTPIQARRAVKQILAIFEMFFPSEGETETRVTGQRMAEGVLGVGRDAIIASLSAFFSSLFTVADLDGHGEITKENFRIFHEIVNIDNKEISDKAFTTIDENKDGKLSMMEFVQAGVDYFLSDDENSPYNVLFGPLED